MFKYFTSNILNGEYFLEVINYGRYDFGNNIYCLHIRLSLCRLLCLQENQFL